MFTSRDVVFEETEYPYLTESNDQNTAPQNVQLVPGTEVLEPLIESRGSIVDVSSVPVEPMEIVPVNEAGTEGASASGEENETVENDTERAPATSHVEETAPITETVEELGRGKRVPRPSVRLRDIVTYNAECHPDKHHTRSESGPPPKRVQVNFVVSYLSICD